MERIRSGIEIFRSRRSRRTDKSRTLKKRRKKRITTFKSSTYSLKNEFFFLDFCFIIVTMSIPLIQDKIYHSIIKSLLMYGNVKRYMTLN